MWATAADVRAALRSLADPELARHQALYFKTGPGEYGDGDIFLGMRVPQIRAVASAFCALPDREIIRLLHSGVHEDRFCALAIMTTRFRTTRDPAERDRMWAMYLQALDDGCVNNWDLVDSTAPYLGEYLVTRPDADPMIHQLIEDHDLWHQRAGVMVTWAFIRRSDFSPTLIAVESLIEHPHDLIHKACGWMLREVGKGDITVLRRFLDEHSQRMPRTMLRYAIERMSPEERGHWKTRK